MASHCILAMNRLRHLDPQQNQSENWLMHQLIAHSYAAHVFIQSKMRQCFNRCRRFDAELIKLLYSFLSGVPQLAAGLNFSPKICKLYFIGEACCTALK
jgi:hypothetical protein